MDGMIAKVKRHDDIVAIQKRIDDHISAMREKNLAVLDSETDTPAKQAVLKVIELKEAQRDSYSKELKDLKYQFNRFSINPEDYRR